LKAGVGLCAALAAATSVSAQQDVEPALAKFIATVKAVDNHTHANSIAVDDADSDALPLDGLPEFALPVRLRPESPEWLAAYKALYGYAHTDTVGAHMDELRATMQKVRREKGDRFPEWVLDQTGTEVMIANRIAMGPGLKPPRFLWASYVDALLLPLSSAAEQVGNGDYKILYPLEGRLLGRYLKDLGIARLPESLDDYQRTVVTATLERQRKGGCVAVKFEAAYLRRLDFDDPDAAGARDVYARYARGGEPTHAEYKALQDYLFRFIAREAGRLGMAVHIHSFEGAGGFYKVAGSDPLLLEGAFNDPSLRGTSFVIVHGGGIYASHAGAMLAKPNVYADFSVMPQFYSASMLAGILRDWLTQYPDKVLYGTDAFANGPDAGWELSAWFASQTARRALGSALTAMMRDGEITLPGAQQIATMALRGNAAKLYKLPLH
jgi:predicted TIM-barrel fold metal-dependent hydrolase